MVPEGNPEDNNMDQTRIKYISTAGLIAAIYVVLILIFYYSSFMVNQIRFAEALTVLPFLTPAAIPGLYVGCLLGNIMGGQGWIDIVLGPLLTVGAAVATRSIRVSFGDTKTGMALAPLPPVLINAFGVPFYLSSLYAVDYWAVVVAVGTGQLLACYVIGLPLLILLRKRGIFV